MSIMFIIDNYNADKVILEKKFLDHLEVSK